MLLEDLVLVSVDDHVVEPPDMFEGRLPARFADQAPRVLDVATTAPRSGASTARTPPTSGSTPWPAARSRSTGSSRPRSPRSASGCFDIHDRVRDMDANGVIGSMCFPSFPQLCGQLFAKATDDRELGLAVLQAYNDWHIERLVRHLPGTIHPARPCRRSGIPSAMADEVRRLSAEGCHAVSFSENPAKLKLPSFHSDHWDPFWSACSRRGDDRLPAHRVVVVAGGDRRRRADRRAARPSSR